MKRATREWMQSYFGGSSVYEGDARDVLDSDARQRAEIRDLRARLKACREAWFDPAGDVVDDERIDRATDLRRKNWRKP